MKSDQPRAVREWPVAALISGASFFVYFFTMSQNFSFDALTTALACESGQPHRWFHPNHLFNPLLGALWFKVERFLGYEGFSIYSLERLHVTLSSLGMGLLYLTLRRSCSRLGAMGGCVFVASSYAVWQNTVDAMFVGMAVFFNIAVAAMIAWMPEKEALRPTHIAALTALSVVAIFVHGIAVFHVIPIALWLLAPRQAAAYLSSVAAAALIVYGGVYAFIVKSHVLQDFPTWAMGYAAFDGLTSVHESPYWTGSFEAILRGLWTGWTGALVDGGLETKAPFLARTALGIYTAAATLRMAPMIVTGNDPRARLTKVFLSWAALETAFLAFWSAGATHFRIHVIVPWVAAFALALGGSRAWNWAQIMAGVVMFLLNFSGSIYPNAFIQNNAGYQMLRAARESLRPGDYLISAGVSIPNYAGLRPYFFPELGGGTIEGRLLEFREKSLDPLAESLQQRMREGRRVYFTTDVMEPALQSRIEAARGLQSGEISRFLAKFELQARELTVPGLALVEAKTPAPAVRP